MDALVECGCGDAGMNGAVMDAGMNGVLMGIVVQHWRGLVVKGGWAVGQWECHASQAGKRASVCRVQGEGWRASAKPRKRPSLDKKKKKWKKRKKQRKWRKWRKRVVPV